MTARVKGRYREVGRLLTDVARWAQGRDDVDAIALVRFYARDHARLASDVDIVILTRLYEAYATDMAWFIRLRPGSRLVRRATWGPLLERRYRFRSGLQVELGLVPVDLGSVALGLRHAPGAQRWPPHVHDPHALPSPKDM